MTRARVLTPARLLGVLLVAGCGSTTVTTGDGSVDDAADDTTTDPGPDTSTDPVSDTTTDPGPDTAADTITDTSTDTAETECEGAGGYCTEYPVIPDTCVTCDSTGPIHYRPAHRGLGAMGCTVEGVGTSPWCCLPHEPGTTDCDEAGGECYPFADPEPCPPGWAIIRSSCGDVDGIVCCAPMSENCP